MSINDAKIAAYADAIAICKTIERSYGPMPAAACRSIAAQLLDRMKEIMERD